MKIDPAKHGWMTAPQTQAVMAALGEARFVGGAVRNAIAGEPVMDIDIAVAMPPQEAVRRLEAAGVKTVPTGIDHGTITAILAGKVFEVTSLRRDVATDGRHAMVAYTDDWQEDAARRDFTMNALYASADGEVFDFAGGVEDLRAGRVRFVGDPARRIAEDYLRILRLFRFHAWYGKGSIDAAALHAAADAKAGLVRLSGERVAKELLRLLEAPAPAPVLRAMAASAILPALLPFTLQLPRLEHLARIEVDNFFPPDPVLRLAALLSGGEAVARETGERLRLSSPDRARLADLGGAAEKVVSYLSVREVRRLLYRIGPARFRDRVLLRWAGAEKEANAIAWRMLLAIAETWERPKFPLTGRDVMLAGVTEGPAVGRILAELEEWWIEGDFTADEFALAERLKAIVQSQEWRN